MRRLESRHGPRERQESLPEVANVMGLLPEAIVGPPEATVFEVSSSAAAT